MTLDVPKQDEQLVIMILRYIKTGKKYLLGVVGFCLWQPNEKEIVILPRNQTTISKQAMKTDPVTRRRSCMLHSRIMSLVRY